MAISDAKKKANARYNKKNMKHVGVAFSPLEKDIYEFLCTKESKSGYIKDLIRQDMGSSKEK